MNCLTPNKCDFDDFSTLCPECVSLLENAAIESTANMGEPEVLGCGECGEWYKSKEDFFNHPCAKLPETFDPEDLEFIDGFLEDDSGFTDDLSED